MADETTPDAVERQYTDIHGQPCDLATLCRREPGWAANRIDTLLAERARHAEEVARLERERDLARITEEELSGSWVRLKDPRDLDPGTYRCMYKHGEPLDLDWDGEAWTGVPSPPVFVFVPNRRSLFAGSCEAEELRSGLEKLMADRGPRGTDAVSRDSLQALLDKVDARDSLLTLETIDSLRDQLRKVEGEREEVLRMIDGLRKSEKTAREYINMRLRDEAQAEGERDEAVAHRLNVATDGVSDPWRPIEECGELEEGAVYLVRCHQPGDGLTSLACSGPELARVIRGSLVLTDPSTFGSEDITHVHRMGPIRGPGEG